MRVWGIEIGAYGVKNGCIFVERLLLGSWTKKEFRKRTQLKYITLRGWAQILRNKMSTLGLMCRCKRG